MQSHSRRAVHVPFLSTCLIDYPALEDDPPCPAGGSDASGMLTCTSIVWAALHVSLAENKCIYKRCKGTIEGSKQLRGSPKREA